MPIRLSPSTLNLFLECPRCFWLQINRRIRRPRGIFPSLPSGMDNVIKKYFDKFRIQDKLPPEIEGKVKGKLIPDLSLINKWRNWRTGLEYEDKNLGAMLFGALDDCSVDGEYYVPLDYKTRGYAPKKGDSEKYYSNQLNCYALLLQENGYKVGNIAYLIYYYPDAVHENGVVNFNIEVVGININPERAKLTLTQAVDLLKGPLPEKHSDCEYCSWTGNSESLT